MRTAKELHDEVIRLDGQLAECRLLVSALFLLVDDLATTPMDGHTAMLRDAISGDARALEREIGLHT